MSIPIRSAICEKNFLICCEIQSYYELNFISFREGGTTGPSRPWSLTAAAFSWGAPVYAIGFHALIDVRAASRMAERRMFRKDRASAVMNPLLRRCCHRRTVLTRRGSHRSEPGSGPPRPTATGSVLRSPWE